MSGGWNSPIVETIDDWVEEQGSAGETVEGSGEPLDLDAYFATPEAIRAGYALLKSHGFCPAEVELLKQVRTLEARLEKAGSDGDEAVTQWRRELTEALAKLGWQSAWR